jgi:hypothetical protein
MKMRPRASVSSILSAMTVFTGLALLVAGSGCAASSAPDASPAESALAATAVSVDANDANAANAGALAPTDEATDEAALVSVAPDGRCCTRQCFGPPRHCVFECHPC